MAPPMKRRRRNTAEASEDEDEQPKTNTLANFLLSSPSSPSTTHIPSTSSSPVKTRSSVAQSSKNGSPIRPTRRTRTSRNDTSSSPKKTKDYGKGDEKGKSADLRTLFSKQTQRTTRSSSSNDKRSVKFDDPIIDPISEDDEISEVKASSSSLVGQHAKKRLKGTDSQPTLTGTFTTSQRFLRPPRPPPVVAEAVNEDLRPWSERFGPRNLEELAVHKKKVSDVRRWLEDVMGGRLRQRLLILKGAAGSGKTTTVRLLANDMNCELLEWKNPAGNTATGFISASAQFEDFLGRGRKFGALDLESSTPSSTSVSSNGVSQNNTKIILIEEFPNTFSRASSALASFRQSILQYLASHTPSLSMFKQHRPTEPISPVVIVISETLLTTTSASADSLTAHRLLGPEILGHPGVGLIEFNAVAPTLLARALEIVVQKESRKSGRRKTPGPLVLKRLGEIGDIRSAVSSLEFLCLKGDSDGDWGAKVTFAKQKKAVKDGIGLTRGEEESLELISQREASLGIFHAVGKVVYNKRDEVASGDPSEKLPSYLSHFSRPKRPQVSVDALIDETGTDTHTFISALHENYVLSCEGTDPMDLSTPMDYVNECIEYLSQSDVLCPSRDIFFGGKGNFGGSGWDSGSQLLRQDEISFQVAVRGMLFSLPNPVKRKTWSMQKGSDAFKMFYPTSLKLWRAKEEIEGLVDICSTKLLKGEDELPTKNLTEGANLFRRNQAPADPSLVLRQRSGNVSASRDTASRDESPSSSAPASLGNAARREMLLDRLPYMAHIARSRKTNMRLRDLEKIVSFQGVSVSPDDESDAEDDGIPGEAWATDKPSEEASPKKKRAGIKPGAVMGMLAQKLVLSDDDIED